MENSSPTRFPLGSISVQGQGATATPDVTVNTSGGTPLERNMPTREDQDKRNEPHGLVMQSDELRAAFETLSRLGYGATIP